MVELAGYGSAPARAAVRRAAAARRAGAGAGHRPDRAALRRAVVRARQEPPGHAQVLDPRSAATTRKTAIYVTHDQSEAFAISDRIVVMNAGRIEQIGTQTDIYLHPRTHYVAEFIGANNSLAATVTGTEGTGDGARVTVDAGRRTRCAAAPMTPSPRARRCSRTSDRRTSGIVDGTSTRTLRERARGHRRAGHLRGADGAAAGRRGRRTRSGST